MARKPPALSKSQLRDLVEDATVDAHDESEQVMGLYTMLDEHLTFPFETEVLGATVVVESLDVTEADDIIVRCRRGKHRQVLSILDLPLPTPPPDGWEWIEAYRHWVP